MIHEQSGGDWYGPPEEYAQLKYGWYMNRVIKFIWLLKKENKKKGVFFLNCFKPIIEIFFELFHFYVQYSAIIN